MTRQQAKQKCEAKFPGRVVVAKSIYPKGEKVCALGLRVPMAGAKSLDGQWAITGFAIVGRGATWERAVIDMETRLVYSTREITP